MPIEDGGVVALDPQALTRPQAGEVMIAPVPLKLPEHLELRGARPGCPVVARKDPYLVAAIAQVLDGRLPDQLVAALVEWRIHVPDGEDAHARDSTRSPRFR